MAVFFFRVTEVCEKNIPFFDKYPIHGIKYKDYLDFVKIKKLMEKKAHLTAEGLDQIRKIKTGMNRGRQQVSFHPVDLKSILIYLFV
jgi:hypothetical protein